MRPHVLAALAILLAAPLARGADPEAEEHFKRGVALYQETDYKAALVEFRRAYEISHNFRVLFNVGEAQYQSNDYAGALTTFERYVREGGDKIPRARRAEVDQEIARLHARTGVVFVTVKQVGADVAIDDVKIGSSPLQQEALVATGSRRIRVTKEGYKPFTATVEIAGGDARKVDVNLEALALPAAPPAAPVPEQPAAPRPAATRRIPWEGWAATGALALGATITGVLAVNANSDLDEARGRFGVSQSELDSASARTRAFSIVSDVCFVGALVAAGVSLYLTLQPAPQKKSGVQPRPALLSGTF